jgi:hypothetical protein
MAAVWTAAPKQEHHPWGLSDSPLLLVGDRWAADSSDFVTPAPPPPQVLPPNGAGPRAVKSCGFVPRRRRSPDGAGVSQVHQ